jgi:hypothetical protein
MQVLPKEIRVIQTWRQFCCEETRLSEEFRRKFERGLQQIGGNGENTPCRISDKSIPIYRKPRKRVKREQVKTSKVHLNISSM